MKKNFMILGAAVLLFSACTNAPEADKAEATDAQQVIIGSGEAYKLDLAASTVGFIGTKPVGQHNGVFTLNEGSVTVNEGQLTGGNFVININSLKITDKDTNGAAMLTGHLLSPDFFDAAKYATARFEITALELYDSTKQKSLLEGATHLISGNLMLKDSTKNISFPAKVAINEGVVNAQADFNIDRTQWGMFYGNDQSLGDKFIRPEVNIKLNIAASKQ
ncbi:MAG: YceI family protein [Bacteroidetes bacterium]|nr:YceI family protein [Bacteroidota bacterium]